MRRLSVSPFGFVTAIIGLLSLSLVHALTFSSVQTTGPIKQIRLSWSDDPRTTMTVTWQTGDPASQSYVAFAEERQSRSRRADGNSVTYPHGTGTIRHAMLTGLKPDMTYTYRIIGSDREGGATEMRRFRTAPGRDVPFVFTAYGDQGVTDQAGDIVNLVIKETPAFHLHLGDLSYANAADRGSVWDAWLELITPLASSVPYQPTLGNHENERLLSADSKSARVGYVAYLNRFALPPPETRYAFDYGCARFVAFNSDDFRNAEQLAWFREALMAARRDAKVRWLIVYVHHPLYSSTVRRENDMPRIEVLEPLLDEFKVDLFLGGHHHNYERTYPLRGGAVQQQGDRYARGSGTVHVVSGGGGRGLYDFVPEQPARTAAREKTHNFFRVRVESRALQCAAMRRDGSTLDRFSLADPR